MLALLGGCASTPSSNPWEESTPFVPSASTSTAAKMSNEDLVAQVSYEASGWDAYDVRENRADRYWDLTLADALRIALENSEVLRDLGGRIVSQPGGTATRLDPVLVTLDPRFGVDAALSNFDTQLSSSFNIQRNNRGLRQPPFGSNNTEIDQRVAQQRATASRLLRTGTRIDLQQGVDFEQDDLGIPPNRFEHAYTPFVSAGIRHPLARGGGRRFTEIAGSGAGPGEFNGIIIAGIRADIAHDEFQIALRDFLYNTVRIYWLLQFAHERLAVEERKLEVARQLHAAAQAKIEAGLIEAEQADRTLERVLAAELSVQNIYTGEPERIIAGILGPNGALVSGTDLGLLSLERRLRFLLGLKANDHRMIRPVERPVGAMLHFDGQDTLSQALVQRPELTRQMKVTQQKRLELVAARRELLPTVDLVSQARLLGFGENLIGSSNVPQDSALHDFFDDGQQEWSTGVEVRWPVGNRIGRAAVRNAMLSVAREDAILEQQKLQINHEVASAIEELQRAQNALALNQQRKQLLETRRNNAFRKFDEGLPVAIEEALETELQNVDASLLLAVSHADHQIALASLGVARGTLLADLGIDASPCSPTGDGFVILHPTLAPLEFVDNQAGSTSLAAAPTGSSEQATFIGPPEIQVTLATPTHAAAMLQQPIILNPPATSSLVPSGDDVGADDVGADGNFDADVDATPLPETDAESTPLR